MSEQLATNATAVSATKVRNIKIAFVIIFVLCSLFYAAIFAFFDINREVVSIVVVIAMLPLALLIYPKYSSFILSLSSTFLLVFFIFMPLMGWGVREKIHYVIIPLALFNIIYVSIVKWDLNKKTGMLRTVNYNIYIIAIVNLLYYVMVLLFELLLKS